MRVWEGYEIIICAAHNVTISLQRCSNRPLFRSNYSSASGQYELTADNNPIEPWITGEFDIAALHRGAPRILNRAQFLDHIERELQRTKKSIDSRFVVILMSLENYSIVIQEKGKKAAELLVRACVEPIGRMLAARDSVALFSNGSVGILLETARLRGMPQDFAAEMVGEIKKAATDCGLVDPMASVGIAKVTGSYVAAADILRDAEIAMRSAEADGHDKTVMFHRGLEEFLPASIAI